eukprot:GFKZ01007395.1.p1 GENE.GFKZ01007395.1~~GFKZ01007395.1.p1  ORF type:complete len:348 (+),score=55.02 GFKZ01007395.1:69-1112(+)
MVLKQVDFDVLWRRWQRLARKNIQIHGRQFTSFHLLQSWAVILGSLYFCAWLSGINGFTRTTTDWASDEDFFKDRHIIFCVSPGRAGSKYLSDVLSVGEGVIGLHEPEPKMTGDTLKQVLLQGRRAETFQQRKKDKIGAIREVLEGMDRSVVYAETSHMFLKTFEDVVLETLGDVAKITLVYLRRPLKDIVWSQLRLGWFEKGHSGRDVWYYNASNVHPSEKAWDAGNVSDVLDLLIGYNIDVLKRGMELQRRIELKHRMGSWKKVKVAEVLLMDLSGDSMDAGVMQFLRRLGLGIDIRKLDILKNMDRNEREYKKERVRIKLTPADVEARIAKLKRETPSLRSTLY